MYCNHQYYNSKLEWELGKYQLMDKLECNSVHMLLHCLQYLMLSWKQNNSGSNKKKKTHLFTYHAFTDTINGSWSSRYTKQTFKRIYASQLVRAYEFIFWIVKSKEKNYEINNSLLNIKKISEIVDSSKTFILNFYFKF